MWRSEVVSAPGGSVAVPGLVFSTQQPRGTLSRYTVRSHNKNILQILKKNNLFFLLLLGVNSGRCELFSLLLKKRGFQHVHQLEGGVLKYGAQVRIFNFFPLFSVAQKDLH